MLNELSLSYRIKSQYNVSFFDSSSSNVVHLLVWQYWWWSLFFFFTIFYFIILSDVFLFKNTKYKPNVLGSLKSNGRWGDLIAGLLPIYWCVNILLNSNMILKVLEWQTETSFCTIRVRGKQWYWVYKISINNKSDLSKCSVVLGKNKQLPLFFFKSEKPGIFLKKIKIIGGFELPLNERNFFHYKLTDSKQNQVFFSEKKNSTFFLKYKHFDFFLIKFKYFSKSVKPVNKMWITVQQQPKTNILITPTVGVFKNNFIFFKKLNLFLKNSISVKNRLISVDNILLLPSRKNITIITNSFDVAHSWFVPGLGLKFDCIPGRSTHNSLFISKPGYYFGHCAEVCGRFHHHMPIKIIALNTDHFVYYYNVTTLNNKIER